MNRDVPVRDGWMGADALDRLATPAGELLGRVDRLLATAGAPAEHAVWPLLRRLRALPGDAVAAVVTLRPEPLAAGGETLRGLLPSYLAARTELTAEIDWEGAAGSVFEAHRASLAAQLGEGPQSIPERVTATAEYAAALADWVIHTRSALARTLAEALGSAEAVSVVLAAAPSAGAPPVAAAPPAGAPPVAAPPLAALPVQRAAAEIGARVLATVVAAYDEAEALLARWRPVLAEVPYRPPVDGPLSLDSTVRTGR